MTRTVGNIIFWLVLISLAGIMYVTTLNSAFLFIAGLFYLGYYLEDIAIAIREKDG